MAGGLELDQSNVSFFCEREEKRVGERKRQRAVFFLCGVSTDGWFNIARELSPPVCVAVTSPEHDLLWYMSMGPTPL